jgi:hypothetical protein
VFSYIGRGNEVSSHSGFESKGTIKTLLYTI